MFKVYYNLPNDILERSAGNTGLIDILQAAKCTICTELSQLKGEKIDMVYMMYNEQVLSQINELKIRKISLFVKGDDDVIVPKNFTKYSSDKMMAMGGKFFNVILNNKSYKADTEIIINGEDHVNQDVVRNICSLFGNVITSTLGKYEFSELAVQVKSRNLPNSGNIFYNVYTMIEGLKKCVIKKNVIKVRSDEYIFDLNQIITYLQTNDKIVTTNISVKKVSVLKFNMSDHVIGGKYERMLMMYSNTMEILNNKITDMRKKLRLEYTPEQILVVGFLKDTLDYFGAKDEKYVKETMVKNFHIIPLEQFIYYKIQVDKKILTTGKAYDKELYESMCDVKSINDI